VAGLVSYGSYHDGRNGTGCVQAEAAQDTDIQVAASTYVTVQVFSNCVPVALAGRGSNVGADEGEAARGSAATS
jgi:hypothetical protein